jgi:hypothetical protein
VDTPGVVSNATRPFDFNSVAKLLAEESDLILYFFNFEHAESLDVIHLYHSILLATSNNNRHLLTILNRTDTADSIKDFAKTFATLMVNISSLKKSNSPEIATGWLFPHWPEYYKIEKKERPRYLGDSDEFTQDATKVLSHLNDAPIYAVRTKIYDFKMYTGKLLWHLKARKELLRTHFWNLVRYYSFHSFLLFIFFGVCWCTEEMLTIAFTLFLCLIAAVFVRVSVSIPDIVKNSKPFTWLPSSYEEEVIDSLNAKIDDKLFKHCEPALTQRCLDIIHTHHPALETKMSEIALSAKQMGFLDLDFELG